MFRKKIIPLSLVLISSLYGEDIVLSEVGVESTVITEVAENAQVSADLATALSSSVPSVDMNRRSGIANDILIRGQKRDNISVEVDGTKVYGACPNRMDPPVSHILANQIESVEVIEGPYDVENFGTLSGGLKITTKKPTKELHGEVNLGMGSWGYKKVGAAMSGGNDKVRMLVSASYENSGQYKDGDGNTIADQIDNYVPAGTSLNKNRRLQDKYHDMDAYTKKSITTKIFVNIVENQELRLSYTGNRSDDILYGNTNMDALYDDSNIYSVAYNIDNISDMYKNINLQYYASDVDHPMGTDYRESSLSAAGVIRNELTTDTQGLKLKNTFSLSGYKLLVGLDGSERKWDGQYTKNGTFTRNSIDDAKTKNAAIFTKLDKSFGSFDVSIGARYDDIEISHATERTNDYSFLGANMITTYHVNKENKIFLGIGQASRVPDARELYFVNPMGMHTGTNNLNETTNTEIDLGYELNSENFTFKVKTFYSMLDDYIYIQEGVAMRAFKNIDATVYGAELSGSYFATDDVSIDTGLSYKRGKKDDQKATTITSDEDLADMAPLRGSVALNYEYANNSMATVEMQASDRWDNFDEDNGEQELGGWAIMNMKVKHALDKHAEFTIGVNNVFDNTYAVSNTYADLNLVATGSGEVMLMNEPGRYFYTNLTFRF